MVLIERLHGINKGKAQEWQHGLGALTLGAAGHMVTPLRPVSLFLLTETALPPLPPPTQLLKRPWWSSPTRSLSGESLGSIAPAGASSFFDIKIKISFVLEATYPCPIALNNTGQEDNCWRPTWADQ